MTTIENTTLSGSDPTLTDRYASLTKWAEIARYKIAQRVHSAGPTDTDTWTYGELYHAIVASGVMHPPMLWRVWIGDVLWHLANHNKVHEEPLYGAFVFAKVTGDVSEGYGNAVTVRYGVTVTMLSEHARIERMKLRAALR